MDPQQPPSYDHPASTFARYFTLEEAVALLPFVKQTFSEARQELTAIKDEIILYERMKALEETDSANDDTQEVVEDEDAMAGQDRAYRLSKTLEQKWDHYEATFYKWVTVLTDQHIEVRDFRKGLIDFPYRAKDGSEYFLCWHWGEEGLFYFHAVDDGFAGRQPISLLPE